MHSYIYCDAASVNPNGTKLHLPNSFVTFFIHGNPFFVIGPRSLPRNPPDCITLDIEFS